MISLWSEQSSIIDSDRGAGDSLAGAGTFVSVIKRYHMQSETILSNILNYNTAPFHILLVDYM